jgi:hypothetical protein
MYKYITRIVFTSIIDSLIPGDVICYQIEIHKFNLELFRPGCVYPGCQYAMGTKICTVGLKVVGTQYGTCFVSPLWRLEFGDGS